MPPAELVTERERRLRRTRHRARFAVITARSLTARFRRLPDFLVIGAQRSGTSSLFRYLGEHPDIRPSVRKEVGYFSRYHDRGEHWYRAHFPTRATDGLTFEATPDYLLHPLAARRAQALVPDATIVAVLRDPVDRAWSHYRHMVSLGLEHSSFEDAIAQELDRLRGERDRLATDPTYTSAPYRQFSYIERGRYAQHLEPWFERFDRVGVFFFDDFRTDPAQFFSDVCSHVGVSVPSRDAFPNHSRPHRGDGERITTIDDTLRETFAADDERLRRLLGRELTW